MHLNQLRGPRWRLDGFCFYLSQRRVFFWTLKTRKTRDVNTGCRTTLEVIIPSRDGLSPEQWKDTATLCPLDWPSNYSLLRLWYIHGSLQKTENNLRSQTGHSHMFTSWTVHHHLFAERVLFRRPPIFEAATVLQDHLRNGVFPNRRLRQRPQAPALEAHRAALTNKPIPLTLTSRTSGRKQLPLTSGTIVTINCKVRQFLIRSLLPSASLALSSPSSHPVSFWDHSYLCLAGTKRLWRISLKTCQVRQPSLMLQLVSSSRVSTCCRGKYW